MSTTMARQGGLVQLEQSNMRLALNMVKIAKGEFSSSIKEETLHLIKKPYREDWGQKMQGVEFPGYRNGKAAMESHPAMVCDIQTDGCPPCQPGTAMNPQRSWRRKETGEPSEMRAALLPGTQPAPAGDNEEAQSSDIDRVLPRYVYVHTALPNA